MAQSVGIKDVARAAGVSVGTVSNVINRPDTVATETRARVQSAIDRLGYVRSESARQLRAGRSRIMGLLVLDMGNPFFVDVARGAERAARDAGLGVMVCNSAESVSEEADYLALFAEQRVRGVLLTPADATGRNIDSFHAARHPVRAGRPGRRGHQRVLGVRRRRRRAASSPCATWSTPGTAPSPTSAARPASTRSATAAPAPSPRSPRRASAPSTCASCPPSASTWPPDGTRAPGCWASPTGRPPCSAPTTCWPSACSRRCTRPSVSVPDDLAIVGYDDIEFAAAAAVPLTSVRQPAVTMGALAADLLLEETEEGGRARPHEHRRVVLQPELVVRRSSLAPR